MNRLLFIPLIFLCACSSMTKVVSTSEQGAVTNEYAYSDKESQIRYNVTNDDKNLHIRLSSTNVTAISKILKIGLKICFDLNGNKNNKIYFEYPLAQSAASVTTEPTASTSAAVKGFSSNIPQVKIPTEALFVHNGIKERIQLASGNSDFRASVRTLNNKEMAYDLIIPFSKISKDGISALSKLTVGIISANAGEGSMFEGMGGGPGFGPGGGGMEGGGPPPGGMPGGGGPPPGGFDISSSNISIDIWFRVILQKAN